MIRILYFARTLVPVILAILSLRGNGQEDIRIEPPFWWTGMKSENLQLLIHHRDIASYNPKINYTGVTLEKVSVVENPNYLFLDLIIENTATPGVFDIVFRDNEDLISVPYELKQRAPGSSAREGFGRSDVIYLLMPDRFANGNRDNDQFETMQEKVNRSDPDGRHGGDLQGVINHLDYLEDLGITALWLNPFLENNNPSYSYHGYAITDFYRTDPRLGTNELYRQLADECHARGIKVIMDMIFNHSSLFHWFIQDLPSSDWIHQFPEFTRSNFRASAICDPYASEYDRDRMLRGWFDWHMPDLNQKNEFLKTYLIQNSIWWIEFSGINGIRLDTQPYPYKEMVAEWSDRIFSEYPSFNIVGEAWLQKAAITSYFQNNPRNRDGYRSNLRSVTDFPLHYALKKAFNENDTWTEGLARLYYILAQDFVYETPEMNVIFTDNHDVTRYFTSVEEDINKFKMGMAFLLTTRGIPMIYYGTEILMTGEEEKGHGFIRKDFPGGWPEDTRNAFSPEGRNKNENVAHDYLRHLLNWRKNTKVLHNGTLTHFVPENGTYVYFRHNENECIMVALNNSSEYKTISTDRFKECISGYTSAVNVVTGEKLTDLSTIQMKEKSATILELLKD